MRKLFITVLMLLTLSGCYQSLDSVNLQKAVQYCKGANNIQTMRINIIGADHVLCSYDVEWMNLATVKLEPKQ